MHFIPCFDHQFLSAGHIRIVLAGELSAVQELRRKALGQICDTLSQIWKHHIRYLDIELNKDEITSNRLSQYREVSRNDLKFCPCKRAASLRLPQCIRLSRLAVKHDLPIS